MATYMFLNHKNMSMKKDFEYCHHKEVVFEEIDSFVLLDMMRRVHGQKQMVTPNIQLLHVS